MVFRIKSGQTLAVTIIWEFRDHREILNPISTDYANRGKINRRRVAVEDGSDGAPLSVFWIARVRSRFPGDRHGDGTGWHRLSLSRGNRNLSLSLVTRSCRRLLISRVRPPVAVSARPPTDRDAQIDVSYRAFSFPRRYARFRECFVITKSDYYH